MGIFDIINKLENVKHNYLIYALEKYTDQISSDDIKKKEEERKKQEEVAKEEIKKHVDDDVKKPKEEEIKKPVEEEVKKFENNIMDSLKWVFISLGIFIFIIIVLSLIYWFTYNPNNNDQNINAPENINQYVNPPVNQYVNPPVNQYINPPANQYVTPPANQYVTPPVNQYVTSKNIDPIKESEESIFSFITPFSRNDKPSEIISKPRAPIEVDTNLEKNQLSDSQLISKAQTETEAYLEKITKTDTKDRINPLESKLDTNKNTEENNISKSTLSNITNVNENKKDVIKDI
jgi:hypothetical protein